MSGVRQTLPPTETPNEGRPVFKICNENEEKNPSPISETVYFPFSISLTPALKGDVIFVENKTVIDEFQCRRNIGLEFTRERCYVLRKSRKTRTISICDVWNSP